VPAKSIETWGLAQDDCVHEQIRGHIDTSEIGPQDIAAASGRSWRRHSAECKARVIALARQLGTSVAAVALANGLNANMLRRWVHEAAAIGGASKSDATRAAATLTSFMSCAEDAFTGRGNSNALFGEGVARTNKGRYRIVALEAASHWRLRSDSNRLHADCDDLRGVSG
jgi:transposase-like protein